MKLSNNGDGTFNIEAGYFKMSNYELCHRAGLTLYRDSMGYVYKAEDVEALLANAKVVYGVDQPEGTWTADNGESCDTHKARLIMVEEIKREPLKVVKEFTRYESDGLSKIVIIPEEFEGKKFKVTFEEVE